MSRILVVDDDLSFRKMLCQVLGRAGYEVREASDGKVALKVDNQERFDLVITDLVMPEGEGIETILELRRVHPDVKIIAISGGGRMDVRITLDVARKLGADRSLAKPFTRMEILEAVAALLGPSKAQPTPTPLDGPPVDAP